MKFFRYLLMFFSLTTLTSMAQVKVSAVLDTSRIRIGEQAHIDIYVQTKSDVANRKIEWPSLVDTITEKVEIISVSAIDTTFPDKASPDNMLQHQRVTISVFDSGYYAIPGFTFVLDNDSAHPAITNPLFIQVHTVPTDTSASKLKDIKPPFDEPFSWKWYLGTIYVVAGIIILIAAIIIAIIIIRRNRKPVVTEIEKPKIPAHITALASLEKIREEKIWKEGRIKEYYSHISDTIRLYIEERFRLMALESTTDEIMRGFKGRVVDSHSMEQLTQLLTLSDLVKFAKLTPVESEHEYTLENAFGFVNGTKQEEERPEDSTQTTT